HGRLGGARQGDEGGRARHPEPFPRAKGRASDRSPFLGAPFQAMNRYDDLGAPEPRDEAWRRGRERMEVDDVIAAAQRRNGRGETAANAVETGDATRS